MAGTPGAREVFGTAAHHPPNAADPHRGEPAVGQRADAHGEIDLVFVQVNDAIAEHQARVQLRGRRAGKRSPPAARGSPEYDRRRDDQLAPGCAILAGDGALGFPQFLEDASACDDVLRPASVSASRRVERRSSGACKCASSSDSLRLTVASGMPSRRPAADRLPDFDDGDEHLHGVQAVHQKIFQ